VSQVFTSKKDPEILACFTHPSKFVSHQEGQNNRQVHRSQSHLEGEQQLCHGHLLDDLTMKTRTDQAGDAMPPDVDLALSVVFKSQTLAMSRASVPVTTIAPSKQVPFDVIEVAV
jgi:hypothetical protein